MQRLIRNPLGGTENEFMKIQIIYGIIFSILICQRIYAQTCPMLNVRFAEEFYSKSIPAYKYSTLLSRFLNGDTTLTDTALVMLVYGHSRHPSYRADDDRDTERELLELLFSNNYSKAYSKAASYLESNPLSLRGHLVATNSAFALGDTINGKKFMLRQYQLLGAVFSSGTGTHSDSAWTVHAVLEEYSILSFLGYRSTRQALIRNSLGDNCDVQDVVSMKDSNDVRSFYFNVTLPWLHEAKKSFRLR